MTLALWGHPLYRIKASPGWGVALRLNAERYQEVKIGK